MSQQPDKCWCAFCKWERKIYRKRHLSFLNVFLCLLLSVLISEVLWSYFDPRMLVLFVSFLFVAELFLLIRWRVTVSCPYCGFDPILYLRNREAAVKKVKSYLENAKGDQFILSARNPWKHLIPVLQNQMKSQRTKNHKVGLIKNTKPSSTA